MKQQIPILKEIRTNWMLILFIGGLIVTWTTFNARLSNAENQIEQLSQVVSDINEININIAKVNKDVEYMKILLENHVNE